MTRHLDGNHGILQSYNYPFNYRDNSNCSYYIYADQLSAGHRPTLCLTFQRFETERWYDYLRVYVSPVDSATYDAGGRLREVEGTVVGAPLTVWEDDFCCEYFTKT